MTRTNMLSKKPVESECEYELDAETALKLRTVSISTLQRQHIKLSRMVDDCVLTPYGHQVAVAMVREIGNVLDQRTKNN